MSEMPGEFLRAALAEREMSQAYLAFATGYTLKHINQIVQGHVRITAHVAAAIERETDIDARALLHMQADIDLEHARDARRQPEVLERMLAGERNGDTESV